MGECAAALLWSIAPLTNTHAETPVTRGAYVMGTVLESTVFARDRATGEALIGEAIVEARRLDAMMTTYDDSSALVRLNRAAGRGPQRVPQELHGAIAASRRLCELTAGTFDITVGALLRDGAGAATGASDVQSLVGCAKVAVLPDGFVDPRIGRPLELDRLACVLAESATAAEALSKALLILSGPDGVRMVEGTEGDAILVDADGRAWSTADFFRAASFEPASIR
jgi:thiamine biosynthesis lipoprotein ApbE